MNVILGLRPPAQFLFWEYINGIVVALHSPDLLSEFVAGKKLTYAPGQ
jgi:hypothetical protein